MKSDNYWRPKNLQSIWNQWIVPLEYGEPVLLMSYPGCDMHRRLTQFIESQSGRECNWVIKNYLTDKWTSLDLSENLQSSTVVIIGFEAILKEGRTDLILQIKDIYRNSNFRVMILCEANYYDEANEVLIQKLPTFEPRIVLHPLYSRDEAIEFVQYLADKWSMKISKDLANSIVDEVGTHLKFIKPIMWYLRDSGLDQLSESLSCVELLWAAKSWWAQFSDRERECLRNIAFDLPTSNVPVMSMEYLIKNRIVINGCIESKFFCNFIKKYEKNPKLMQLEGDKLIVQGEDYSSYFISTHKTILSKLLSAPGKLVSRSELMDLINVDSDWALDSHLSRLRAKVEAVGIGKYHIVTRRGMGVLWRT